MRSPSDPWPISSLYDPHGPISAVTNREEAEPVETLAGLHVSPLRILIAQSRQDVLADVILEAVRAMSDMALVVDAVVPMSRVATLLSDASSGVNVLVTIGDTLFDPTRTTLERYPNLMVAHISIGADIAHLDIRNVGLGQLLSTLRALARDDSTQVDARSLEYEVVVDPMAAAGSKGRIIRVRADDEPLLSLARRWIDAALLSYCRSMPARGGDLPGLTRSAPFIERQLSAGVDDGEEVGPDIEWLRSRVRDAAGELDDALYLARGRADAPGRLLHGLALSDLEMHVVLMALAPEIDVRYQEAFGYLLDDLGRRTASLGLVCALLGDALAVRRELAQSARLVDWGLLESGVFWPAADEPLRLDQAVATWLLGDAQALQRDLQRRRLVRTTPWFRPAGLDQAVDTSIADDLGQQLRRGGETMNWLLLTGPDPDVWRATVEVSTASAGLVPMRVPLCALTALPPQDVDDAILRLARAARLSGVMPVIDDEGCHANDSGAELLGLFVRRMATVRGIGIVITTQPQRLVRALPDGHCLLRRDSSDARARRARFGCAAARNVGLPLDEPDARRLAASFSLPLSAIDDAMRLAALNGAATLAPERRTAAIQASLRSQAAPQLPRFAIRVEPVVALDDIVLPEDRRSQLGEMVAHVREAHTVLERWGFGARCPANRGIAALFCGPSGTGKSMAAQAIAHALQTEMYAVDLSRIVSKYIGESEKNLDTVFGEAEQAGAVLLFDEADALFGKRSEVKDAHDRYANIEVAYLLQRMEAFSGLAILTTNLRQNLDQAFLRRLRFVVEFPKPDAAARESIWRHCLPESAPLGADIDFRFLARRVELTGGNISQITLRAAFLAAQESSLRIGMRHVLAATRAEMLKLGMTAAERDITELDAARREAAARAA